jgi:periplasmic protein CpxP/Spy
MDSTTKNKSLVSIIIFLLITNVAMLVFFLVLNNPAQKSRGRDQNGMAGMLQKEVGFSQTQLDTYQSLRKEQLDSIHMLFDGLKKSRMDFYSMIYSSGVGDSTLNKSADLIAEKQKILDLKMFNHFKQVRNICTPDQLQKFDSSIKKIFFRMAGRTGKH